MKWSEWAESFTIFAKYGDEDYMVCAEHDIVYAGPHDFGDKITPEDIKRLDELGWIPSEEGGFSKFT